MAAAAHYAIALAFFFSAKILPSGSNKISAFLALEPETIDLATTQKWGSSVIWLYTGDRDKQEVRQHGGYTIWVSELSWEPTLAAILERWVPSSRLVVVDNTLGAITGRRLARRLSHDIPGQIVTILAE